MKIFKFIKKDPVFNIVIIFIISVCIFMCLTFIPIKTNIRKTVNGIQLSPQKNTYEEVELKIDGVYYNYILELFDKRDYFRGTLELSNMEKTKDPAFAHIFMIRLPNTSSDIKNGSCYYVRGSDSFSIGYITQKNLFSQILINLSGDEEKYYAFPAVNVEDAEQIRDKLEAWKYPVVK